jgi:deoxyadenosine/deoxycytidine kinase
MDRHRAAEHILEWAQANIDESDREQFREIAEDELLALHEGNFARFQVRPSEFQAWQHVWNDSTVTGRAPAARKPPSKLVDSK